MILPKFKHLLLCSKWYQPVRGTTLPARYVMSWSLLNCVSTSLVFCMCVVYHLHHNKLRVPGSYFLIVFFILFGGCVCTHANPERYVCNAHSCGSNVPCAAIYKTRTRIQLYTLMHLHFLFCPLRVVAHYSYGPSWKGTHRVHMLTYAMFGNIVFSVIPTSGKIDDVPRRSILPRGTQLPGSTMFFTRIFAWMLSFLLLRTTAYAYFRKAVTLRGKHLHNK